MNSHTIPVLLDTDIGSNIDDALALAYLLKQPRCELLGITTVTGEAGVRAQLADAVCGAFGRTAIPIQSGADRPILVPQQQPDAPQKSVLAHWLHREQFAPNSAVEFLRQTIRAHPGEITLLSLGALTNIGLLFVVDPEIPGLLKQYVMMGGRYHASPPADRAETNAGMDPHAAAIVFAAKVPGMRCVGLDVTTRCRMSAEDCRRHLNRDPLKILLEMAEVWLGRSNREITFHDPLAAACVFEPGLCRFEAGRVEVELQSERDRGMTCFHSADGGPHHVAVAVQPELFLAHYFGTVEGA